MKNIPSPRGGDFRRDFTGRPDRADRGDRYGHSEPGRPFRSLRHETDPIGATAASATRPARPRPIAVTVIKVTAPTTAEATATTTARVTNTATTTAHGTNTTVEADGQGQGHGPHGRHGHGHFRGRHGFGPQGRDGRRRELPTEVRDLLTAVDEVHAAVRATVRSGSPAQRIEAVRLLGNTRREIYRLLATEDQPTEQIAEMVADGHATPGAAAETD